MALWVLVVGLALTLSDAAALAQSTDSGSGGSSDPITMMVVPSSLSLDAGEEADVAVVVTNGGSAEATVRSVDLYTPTGVVAEPIQVAVPLVVQPGQRVRLDSRVSVGLTAQGGELVAVADVSAPTPPGSGLTVERFVTATTKLSVVAVDVQLAVTIASAPSTLSDGQSNGELTVLVRNTTAYELTTVEIRPISSMDIDVRPGAVDGCAEASEAIACIDRLASGAAELISLGLDVDSEVRIGKQTIGVVVTAVRPSPTVAVTVTSSATVEVNLEVFGIGAVGPLGKASLFLFPAFVALLVFLVFSRLAYPRSSWLPSKIDVSDVTWTVALLPVATLLYLAVWLIWGVNLTQEIGTRFVIVLAVLGFVLGVVAWGAFATAYLRTTGRRQFKVGDSPRRVLERLALNSSSLGRPQLADSASAELVLGNGPGGTIAVSSPILYTFSAEASAAQREAFGNLVDSGDPNIVVNGLGAEVKLHWSTGVRLIPPTAVPGGAAQGVPLLVEQ